MIYLSFLLNLPWTLIGIISALFSVPRSVEFSKNPFTITFRVRSFWWYRWLPGKQGVRAMVHGNVVQLAPTADEKDLEHELVHVKQYERAPLIHPLLYFIETLRYGYKQNKYEVEAYEKAGNLYCCLKPPAVKS